MFNSNIWPNSAPLQDIRLQNLSDFELYNTSFGDLAPLILANAFRITLQILDERHVPSSGAPTSCFEEINVSPSLCHPRSKIILHRCGDHYNGISMPRHPVEPRICPTPETRRSQRCYTSDILRSMATQGHVNRKVRKRMLDLDLRKSNSTHEEHQIPVCSYGTLNRRKVRSKIRSSVRSCRRSFGVNNNIQIEWIDLGCMNPCNVQVPSQRVTTRIQLTRQLIKRSASGAQRKTVLTTLPRSSIWKKSRNENLTVCELNCRSVRNKTLSLSDFITSNDFDVMGLTETWLNTDIDTACIGELVPTGYTLKHVPKKGWKKRRWRRHHVQAWTLL